MPANPAGKEKDCSIVEFVKSLKISPLGANEVAASRGRFQ
jgi:hypothetical protein